MSVIGSPLEVGSVLTVDEVARIVKKHLAEALPYEIVLKLNEALKGRPELARLEVIEKITKDGIPSDFGALEALNLTGITGIGNNTIILIAEALGLSGIPDLAEKLSEKEKDRRLKRIFEKGPGYCDRHI